jgi:hypothetical protein
VSELTAQVIVSEIGIDMSRFPAAGHLISWAGLCPRNDESAGKRRYNRLRRGAPWLKTTLLQCAWAGVRKKASYLNVQFQRLRHRRGPEKAICAVAASILTAAYHMLRDGTFYRDLGPHHYQQASPKALAQRLAKQIAQLGFACTITEAHPWKQFLFSCAVRMAEALVGLRPPRRGSSARPAPKPAKGLAPELPRAISDER